MGSPNNNGELWVALKYDDDTEKLIMVDNLNVLLYFEPLAANTTPMLGNGTLHNAAYGDMYADLGIS